MIINKSYEINYRSSRDIDDIILLLAEDIKNGFTIESFEFLGDTVSYNTYSNKPDWKINLKRKEYSK